MIEETRIEAEQPQAAPLTVTEPMKADLLSTASWARFLMIIEALGLALLFIASIVMICMGSTVATGTPWEGMGTGMGVTYVIIVLVCIYPVVKGFSFCNNTKAACQSNDQEKLARAFRDQRLLIRFCGVLTIVLLIFYAIFLIAGIVAGVAGAFGS